jgi:ATP-binding cassette subfamily F protein uup
LRLRTEESRHASRQPIEIPAKRKAESKSRPRKLTWKEQQELNELEGRIEILETEKASLQAEINCSGSDYVRLQTLAGKLHAVETELDTVMERWLELAEI